jgi:hypothetical protein
MPGEREAVRFAIILLSGVILSMYVENRKITRQNENLRAMLLAMQIDQRDEQGVPCRH